MSFKNKTKTDSISSISSLAVLLSCCRGYCCFCFFLHTNKEGGVSQLDYTLLLAAILYSKEQLFKFRKILRSQNSAENQNHETSLYCQPWIGSMKYLVLVQFPNVCETGKMCILGVG